MEQSERFPKGEKFIGRLLEVLPGITAWVLITSPVWGGIFFPEFIAYFVLVFNAFWLYKSLSTVILFVVGYSRIRNGENVDWMSRVLRLEDIDGSIAVLEKEIGKLKKRSFSKDQFANTKLEKLPHFLKIVLFRLEKQKTIRFLKKEVRSLQKIDRNDLLDWKEMHHIVIIPFWKEPYAVLKRSLNKLAWQTFPYNKISVVLGAEERHPPAYKMAERLQREFKDKFEYIWVNNHTLTADEIVGKGANMASCGRLARKKIEELGWDKTKVTITSCDSDTQFDKQYFAYLTYLYVKDPNRLTHFYAAPMVYYANIWKVPFYSRVANTIFTVNNIGTAVRPDKYIQVSSYSFSWTLLEDIDFWSVDVVPEDFHMFFKALFIHGDSVYTVPIFLKNLSDAAESIGHMGNIKNQYEQVKRWAWGVSDNSWMIRSLLKASKKTPYMIYRVAHTVFDHLTWSVISFILMFGANIPPLVNPDFSRTVFGQKLPKVSSFILTVSSLTFVLIIILDFFIKPRREEKISIFKFLLEQLQWITFPVVSFIFGAVPGLDAQTRLLFGKYMEHRLTEKH